MDRDAFTMFVINGSKTSNESQTTLVGNGSNTHDFLAEANELAYISLTKVAKRAQYFVSDIQGLPFRWDKITISRTQADGIISDRTSIEVA